MGRQKIARENTISCPCLSSGIAEQEDSGCASQRSSGTGREKGQYLAQGKLSRGPDGRPLWGADYQGVAFHCLPGTVLRVLAWLKLNRREEPVSCASQLPLHHARAGSQT